MKRSITIGVVIGSLILGAVAGWAAAGFTDVPEDSPHAPAIEWAVGKGIISGKTADTFDPHGPLTRAQMVTILHRYHSAFPQPTVIDYKEADLVLRGGDVQDLVLRVGTDIQPGVYSVEHGWYCVIQRFSGFQYTNDQLIWETDRGRRAGRVAVEIKPSDVAVRFRNCD